MKVPHVMRCALIAACPTAAVAKHRAAAATDEPKRRVEPGFFRAYQQSALPAGQAAAQPDPVYKPLVLRQERERGPAPSRWLGELSAWQAGSPRTRSLLSAASRAMKVLRSLLSSPGSSDREKQWTKKQLTKSFRIRRGSGEGG